MGKIKKLIPIIITITLFFISVALLIFPTVSNALFFADASEAVIQYNNNIASLSKAEKEKYLSRAKEYNLSLTETVSDDFSSNAYKTIASDYDSILNFGDGQICTVKIPKINVSLPVYHGTSKDVLTKGAAHNANTSFPIGGIGTHCVISAHTAYPGKVFFDDLNKLEKGDVFYINVLDEQLTYKVSDINIVEPEDTSKLQIAYDKDLVTLVTCYPYAVNSHRLIVTGERILNIKVTDQMSTKKSCFADNRSIVIFTIATIVLVVIITIIVFYCCKKRIITPHN